MRFITVLLMAALVAGCSIDPVTHIKTPPGHAGLQCEFKRNIIDVPDPYTPLEAAVKPLDQQPDPQVVKAIDAAGGDGAMLFLSGGSLHGAFGAGYLYGLKQGSPSGQLPNYAVVTGVSTGAIIASFAFINEPEKVAALYRIERESQLLTPLVSIRDGKPTMTGAIGVLKKGAVADLAPLRAMLTNGLDDHVLDAVAEGAKTRMLRIGVVDVDLGAMVALNLGEMATRWHGAKDAKLRDFYKSCYVEAIVASASSPLAALPVFIDNRMYVDGGVRFGAFTDEVGRLLSDSKSLVPVKPQIYLIFNGYQRLSPACARADKKRCPNATLDPETLDDAHAKWSFVDLALRANEIVANQIYRLSAINVAYSARVRDLPPPWFAKIDDDALTFVPAKHGGGDPLSCQDAKADDAKPKKPVQFYPRYMRCIVSYGEWRGKEEGRQGHPRPCQLPNDGQCSGAAMPASMVKTDATRPKTGRK